MVDEEKRKRIQVALWAYAYEIMNDPIVPDGVYDGVSHSIDTSISTGDEEMDNWFKENFVADTGQWIHIYPHLDKLKKKYDLLQKVQKK